MQRFLIEVTHDPDPWACAKVVEVFLRTGSHYLAGADWGCRDGDHKAWMIVDAETRDEARQVVPPPFRSDAHVVGLNRFTLDEIEKVIRDHEPAVADRPCLRSRLRVDSCELRTSTG